MDVCEICDAISELDDARFIQVAEHVIQDMRCRLMRHAGEDAAEN